MKCPSCNTENPIDAIFCRNCGQQIKQISTHESLKGKQKQKNKYGGCLLFFLIGILTGVIVFLISNSIYNSHNDNSVPVEFSENTDTTESDEPEDYINVDVCELYFDASDEAKTITVDASSSFSISSDLSDWGHTSIEDNEIRVWLDNNESETSRDDWFEITCGSKTKRVDVHQNGNPYAQTAEIEKIWVDYNAFDEYERKGMRIHIKFTLKNLLNVNCRTTAYFYFEDGTIIRDENNQYYSVDGQVSVGETFTPPYEISTYNDFKLFIPISELHLHNSASCYFVIYIKNKDADKIILRSDKNIFNFTKD